MGSPLLSSRVSSILVFRAASEQQPAELAAEENENKLQGADKERIAYSREIQTVGRKYWSTGREATADPNHRPSTIKVLMMHLSGKASTVFYWYRGEWRTLSGDD